MTVKDYARAFATILVTGVASGLAAAELLSERDLIGTWKIEPSTFKVRTRAIPKTFPRPQLPTNYSAFALILKEDGSLVATNMPQALFFGWPGVTQITGTWWVRTNWPLFAPTNAKNAYSDLGLLFVKPAEKQTDPRIIRETHGVTGGPVFRSINSTSSAPVFGIGPYEDDTRTYEWTVSMKKQQ